jgi:YHS domain-containing protein
MSYVLWSAAAVVLIVFVISVIGCGRCATCPPQSGGTSSGAALEKGAPGAAAPEPSAESAPANSADYAENLAELSPEDRALVAQQKICPVSGETLGSMGKPVKVTVQGRVVFLCCPGCKKEIERNPEKYLAKIPAPKPK